MNRVPVESAGLRFEVDGRIGRLTIDRPERMNAIDFTMTSDLARLSRELPELASRDEVRVLVIRGAGNRAFTVGADLVERRSLSSEDRWAYSERLFSFTKFVHAGPIPVVSSVSGHCLGAGLEIAMASDFRLATTASSFGFPEVGLGVFPGVGGAVFGPRLLGPARARELLLLGRRFDAAKAERCGLIDSVAVDHEDLDVQVDLLATELVAAAPCAVRALKTLLTESPSSDLAGAYRLSDRLRKPLNDTQDHAEGLAAFAQRRAPRFVGR